MNKPRLTLSVLLQILIWAALFFSPLMFVGNGEKINFSRFLINSAMPLALLIVFYANYLYLAPKYLANNRKLLFWSSNILMIIVMAMALHAWMEMNYAAGPTATGGHRPHHPGESSRILFIFRDIINLSISAITATAITLSRRWTEADEARRKAEAARTEAELKNLRNQVNPHFLLNTLNNIYALTAFDKEKAQAAILELSGMLRHILYDNQQPFVDIQNEVAFIHNYINLMKIRINNNVDVKEDISISENCDVTIAPLIFISLIENAFKHGISPTGRSFIHIAITADDSKIECRIVNSNHPKTHADRSGHGIGLLQVEQRLKLSYGEKYEWTRGVNETDNTYTSKIIIYETKMHHNRR